MIIYGLQLGFYALFPELLLLPHFLFWRKPDRLNDFHLRVRFRPQPVFLRC